MKAVTLWDLPENRIYVKIKKNARIDFFNFIKANYGGAKRLTKLLDIGIKKEYIYNWKNCIRFCPLYIINKLLSLLEDGDRTKYMKLILLNLEKIKSGSKGHSISIKFPIRLSKELARVAGHLLGDGGISASGKDKYRVYYTNKKVELVDEFIRDISRIFGPVNIPRHIDKTHGTTKIKLPRIFGIILTQFFGPQCNGFKHVPECIMNSRKAHKVAFIHALFDDEGSVDKNGRKMQISLTIKEILEKTKYLLLNDFGIRTSRISKFIKGGNRKPLYGFHITSHDNFTRFYDEIGFSHPIKSNNLRTLIMNYRPTYKTGEIEILIQNLLKEKNMTAKELAEKLKRRVGTVKQRLRELERERTITSNTLKQNLKIYYIKPKSDEYDHEKRPDREVSENPKQILEG